MRRITCDHHEFDPPDSEQRVEIVIATPSRSCPDLDALMAAVGVADQQALTPTHDWGRWAMVADHLNRFACIDLPEPWALREARLIADDWDLIEVAVSFGSTLVWHHWSTSA